MTPDIGRFEIRHTKAMPNHLGAGTIVVLDNNPGAALLHLPVLSGSLEPVIVQAGGSHGTIEWNEGINPALMKAELTYTHAYRYTQSDFKAAIDCISAIPEQAGRLISSITASSDNDFSGARRALQAANTERGPSAKRLVSYPQESNADDFFDSSTG
jgi:hypothetical protein